MKGQETKKEKMKAKSDSTTVKVVSDYQKEKKSKNEIGSASLTKK